MAVDIKLNQMISTDQRLHDVLLEDVELSVRSFAGLTRCGAVTLYDAQTAIINRTIHKQKGIGPRAIKEIEEIIHNVLEVLPPSKPVGRSIKRNEMTDAERKALVERLWFCHANGIFDAVHHGKAVSYLEAADQIEADGKRIAALEDSLIAASREIVGLKDALAQVAALGEAND